MGAGSGGNTGNESPPLSGRALSIQPRSDGRRRVGSLRRGNGLPGRRIVAADEREHDGAPRSHPTKPFTSRRSIGAATRHRSKPKHVETRCRRGRGSRARRPRASSTSSGLGALARSAVPVLEGALERSVMLAAAMVLGSPLLGTVAFWELLVATALAAGVARHGLILSRQRRPAVAEGPKA